jgi:hypothetical protein
MSPVAVKVSKAVSDAAGHLAVALGTAIADQIHKGVGSSVCRVIFRFFAIVPHVIVL